MSAVTCRGCMKSKMSSNVTLVWEFTDKPILLYHDNVIMKSFPTKVWREWFFDIAIELLQIHDLELIIVNHGICWIDAET